MNCKDVCEIGVMALVIAFLLGLVILFLVKGSQVGREDIMEKCDKVGEFTVQEYTYECELKEKT